jgi:hypothetical protein
MRNWDFRLGHNRPCNTHSSERKATGEHRKWVEVDDGCCAIGSDGACLTEEGGNRRS